MNDELRAEVDRRVQAIRRDPQRRMRYDFNGDGLVDEAEWEEVYRIVTAEVQTEFQRAGKIAAPDALDVELIAERYELGEVIGQGGQGITRRAHDRQTGQTVVVKELRIERLDDWKAVELFEREGRALEALDHPAIPSYVDSFHLNSGDSSRLVLVQEYEEGVDLARAMDEGLRLTEAQVIELIGELLEILGYIHSLDPPIIHRDIKPANIIRRADGSVALVDFGAARTVLADASGGSTVVGTSGYMPLEQLMGRAVPATDLYAVGATAIHLLSHKHPADIDVLQMKLQFHGDIAVSPGLQAFLDTLVEPHVEDRYQTAGDALAALRRIGEIPAAATAESSVVRPAPSAAKAPAPLTHAPNQGGAQVGGFLGNALESMASTARQIADQKLGWAQGFFDGQSYEVPPGFWTDTQRDAARVLHRQPQGISGAMGSIFAVVLIYALMGLFGFLLATGRMTGNVTFGWIMVSSFSVVGLVVAYKAALTAGGIEEFELTADAIIHRERVFGRERTKVIPLDDVEAVDITWSTSTSSDSNGYRRTRTYYYFVIRAAGDEHRYGKEMTKDEKLWAASAIRDHVQAHRGAHDARARVAQA